MRFLCLLLGVATMPSLVAAEPEPRVTFSSTLEGASSNAGSPVVFSPDGVAFSADGKYVATGTGGTAKDGQRLGGALQVWNVHTGKAKASLLDGILPTAVAFSPNNKQLATADLRGKMLLWDVENSKRVATLQQYVPGTAKGPNPTYSLAFSPEGKTLAAGTMQGIKLWVLGSDKKSARVDGPEAIVWSVAWSADGKTLATGGSEKGDSRPDFETESTVRLWQYHPADKTGK